MANQTVADAIARSQSHNEIVTLDFDPESLEELECECDDSCDGNDVHEFWAAAEDSEHEMAWRVHVRKAPTVKVDTDSVTVWEPDDDDDYDPAEHYVNVSVTLTQPNGTSERYTVGTLVGAPESQHGTVRAGVRPFCIEHFDLQSLPVGTEQLVKDALYECARELFEAVESEASA